MRLLSATRVIYLVIHLVLFLLGFLLAKAEEILWQGVGYSLIAAGITGWVIFVYLLLAENTRQRIETLTDLGILKGFSRRGVAIKDEYDARLTKAKKQIDIMGFGLRALREDYVSDFQTWKNRARVRILLIDPRSPELNSTYADQRDSEEANATGTIRQDVETFLEQIQDLLDDRFSVRLYTCLPSINVFRVDSKLFWGPYFLCAQSRNTPTFLVRKPGLLFDPISSHFEEIWQKHSVGAAEWLKNE